MAIEDERFSIGHSASETSNDSQSVTPHLSDVIVEVLLRLPVESVLRCRSVCKLWRSIISDSHFIKSHLRLSTNDNLYSHHRLILSDVVENCLKSCLLYDVMYRDHPINELELDYPLKHSRKAVRMVISCNGLLCVAIEDDILFIWNPSTKKSKKSPYIACKGHILIYNMYGFGYDESTDDYKVVCISYCHKKTVKYHTMVKIWSLKFGNWKEIGGFPHGFAPNDSGTFLNGSLHWAARNECGSWALVSLDLAKETFGEVLPPAFGKGFNNLRLGSLGEWLCVVCTYPGYHEVWVMKVYGMKDSWTKLFSIRYRDDILQDLILVPLLMINDGKALLQFGSRLVVYDTKNSAFSEIHKFDRYVRVHTLVESLVTLGDNNDDGN